MPKNLALKKILLLGSGPIVIGQGCEFDYSGVQACKALAEEGYEVVLLNSNPATIMTDPEFAARTYIEPITVEIIEKIIIAERPDALLPTLGGQTALNAAMDLQWHQGILSKYNGVQLIGANAEAIEKGRGPSAFQGRHAQDRPRRGSQRRGAHDGRGARDRPARTEITRSSSARRLPWAARAAASPTTRRNSRTIVTRGLDLSPVKEVLIEESLLGWKEFEMEVMRDRADNCVLVCSIENFDPMGVHTGDSITVAPTQTLSDREFQIMRDASFAVIREIGVETGGSNIQFAVESAKTGA